MLHSCRIEWGIGELHEPRKHHALLLIGMLSLKCVMEPILLLSNKRRLWKPPETRVPWTQFFWLQLQYRRKASFYSSEFINMFFVVNCLHFITFIAIIINHFMSDKRTTYFRSSVCLINGKLTRWMTFSYNVTIYHEILSLKHPKHL